MSHEFLFDRLDFILTFAVCLALIPNCSRSLLDKAKDFSTEAASSSEDPG